MDDSGEISLSSFVKYLREAKGWSQSELARKLLCAPSYVCQIEGQPERASGIPFLPSEDWCRKLSAAWATSPEEEIAVRQRLLLARSREIVPLEVRGYMSDRHLSSMPDAFLSRLRTDVEPLSTEELARVEEGCRLSGWIAIVLRGQGYLTPLEVAVLANALGQSKDEYLVAAEYMSDGMKMLLKEYDGGVNFLEVVAGLTPETRRELERIREKWAGSGMKKPAGS